MHQNFARDASTLHLYHDDDKGTTLRRFPILKHFVKFRAHRRISVNSFVGYLLRIKLHPKGPIFETMSLTDDQEELLSSTEVDESLMGDEKQWHSQELQTRKRSKMNAFMIAFESYRWLVDTILVLVIIGLLLLLWSLRQQSPSSSWQVGGDFTGAGLKCLSSRNTRQWLYRVLIQSSPNADCEVRVGHVVRSKQYVRVFYRRDSC